MDNLSKLMGHADVSTTQIYLHLVQKDLDKAMRVLENDAYSKVMGPLYKEKNC